MVEAPQGAAIHARILETGWFPIALSLIDNTYRARADPMLVPDEFDDRG